MTQPDWLNTAVRKSQEHTWTLGHVFAMAHRLEGKSPDDLATELGCSRETLDWLALCRRPDESRFAEDLRVITDRFQLAPLPLVRLIRRVESLAAFTLKQAGQESSDVPTLLAARDREDDDESDS